MQIETSERGGSLTVAVRGGRIDAACAQRFKDDMRLALACEPRHVLLDLSEVEFIDSSGLGAIIASKKALPQGAEMALAGLQPRVARVFALTRMDRVFAIHEAGLPPGHSTAA